MKSIALHLLLVDPQDKRSGLIEKQKGNKQMCLVQANNLWREGMSHVPENDQP